MTRGKMIAAMVVVFVAGFLVGVLSTGAVVKRYVQRYINGGPASARQFVVSALDHELKLTPEQREKLQPVISQAHSRLLAVRGNVQPEVDQIFSNAVLEMKVSLTPEQVERLDVLLGRLKQRWSVGPQK